MRISLHFRCYKCGEDNPFLLFEDLRMTGYKNVDKSLGLNFEQLKLGLTTLAKWHAATATLGVTVGVWFHIEILPFSHLIL